MSHLLDTTIIKKNIFDTQNILDTQEWEPLAPGVRVSYLYKDEKTGNASGFIHYDPGTSVRKHRHTSFEHVIVLSGQQEDDMHEYKKGSFVVQKKDSIHKVKSKSGCLVLVVWAGKLDFLE
jgi:anti-sigma factor ChrR (cupin superfamily)